MAVMRGRNVTASIAGILIIAGGAGAIWYAGSGGVVVPKIAMSANAGAAASPEISYTVPPLGDIYKNDEFRFSLSLPEGFTAREFAEEGATGKTVILEDVKGNGIQILVTPFPSAPQDLTADMVKQDIPDLEVTDVQAVEVGANSRGIAFKSDNSAFGGASREVWFVFRGNLYQISTYARLDTFLQAMFGTWKFF